MSSRYLDMIRGQRRRSPGFQFTSKTLLALLALIAMGGSAVYWWGVQSVLTDNRAIALAFTAILRLAHLVKRYELQTQADIAILRATLLRAQEKALIGFANLTVEEREELAAVMRSLVGGIDRTLREVGQTVKTVSGVAIPFDGMLDDNEDIRDVLEYISESLVGSTLTPSREVERP